MILDREEPRQGGHPALKQPEGRQRSEGAGCLALLPTPSNSISNNIFFCDLDIGQDLPAVLARAVALRSLVVVSAVVGGCSPLESNLLRGMKQSFVFCQIVYVE